MKRYIPPSATELRQLLQALNLTQEDARQLIDVSRRTMTRYNAAGGETSSMPYACLFTLLARSGWGMVHPDTWRHQISHRVLDRTEDA